MNSYYQLIQTLESTFEEDPNVNTIISTGDQTQLDDYRKNLYPIIEIYVLNSSSSANTNAVTKYDVEITAVTVRDISKEQVNDKLYRNDNYHDNMNMMRGVLKLTEIKLQKSKDVRLISTGAAEPITFKGQNLLDGWRQTWSFDVKDSLNTWCSIIDVESYTPSTLASGGSISTIGITFNVVPTVEDGSFTIVDSNNTVIETFTQADISQSTGSRSITITVTGSSFENPADGTYYIVFTEGMIHFRGQDWSSAFEGDLIITVS